MRSPCLLRPQPYFLLVQRTLHLIAQCLLPSAVWYVCLLYCDHKLLRQTLMSSTVSLLANRLWLDSFRQTNLAALHHNTRQTFMMWLDIELAVESKQMSQRVWMEEKYARLTNAFWACVWVCLSLWNVSVFQPCLHQHVFVPTSLVSCCSASQRSCLTGFPAHPHVNTHMLWHPRGVEIAWPIYSASSQPVAL